MVRRRDRNGVTRKQFEDSQRKGNETIDKEERRERETKIREADGEARIRTIEARREATLLKTGLRDG